jgi:hypothetical protein
MKYIISSTKCAIALFVKMPIKFYLIILALCSGEVASGATYFLTTANAASAHTPASWNTVAAGGGTAAANFTTSGDIFIIPLGTAGTFLNASTFALNVTLQVNGTFTIGNGNSTNILIIDGKIIFTTNTTQVTIPLPNGSKTNSFTLASGAKLITSNINGISGANCSLPLTAANVPVSLDIAADYEFNGAAQATLGFPSTANNLTLSGSGAKTFATTPTINGILSMQGTATIPSQPTYGANATLQYNTATARTAGAEWPATFTGSGGIIIASTGAITLNAAKILAANNPLIINSGATLITNNFQLTFGGSFVNTGILTSGSSNITIANIMVNQSIAGFTTIGNVLMTKTSGTATFAGDVTGGELIINGVGGSLNLGAARTHTFSGALALTNGTLNGGSSTIKLASTFTTTNGILLLVRVHSTLTEHLHKTYLHLPTII